MKLRAENDEMLRSMETAARETRQRLVAQAAGIAAAAVSSAKQQQQQQQQQRRRRPVQEDRDVRGHETGDNAEEGEDKYAEEGEGDEDEEEEEEEGEDAALVQVRWSKQQHLSVDASALRAYFARYGAVIYASLSKRRTRTAHVCFLDADSAERAVADSTFKVRRKKLQSRPKAAAAVGAGGGAVIDVDDMAGEKHSPPLVGRPAGMTHAEFEDMVMRKMEAAIAAAPGRR